MTTRPRPHDYSLTPSNIPIPDPTVITGQEIAKAKTELRREFEILLNGLDNKLAATREGYVHLFEARLQGAVDQLNEKVAAAMGKFEGIDQRLGERDRRFDAMLISNREASGVQIIANASALAKSEASFTKEFDGIKALIEAMKEGFYADIANLKGRMDRGEGGYQGQRLQTEDHRAATTVNILIVSGVVGFLVLLVMIAGLWFSSHPVRSQPELAPGTSLQIAPNR